MFRAQCNATRYDFGTQRSYNSLSTESKHVNKDASARTIALRAGVACAEVAIGRYRAREDSRMRAEPLDIVDEVGDASTPRPGVP